MMPFLHAGGQTLVMAIQEPVEIAVKYSLAVGKDADRPADSLSPPPSSPAAPHSNAKVSCNCLRLSFCDEPEE